MEQRTAMTEQGAVLTRPSVAQESDRIALRERNLRLLATLLWLTALTLIASTLLIWAGRGFPRAPVAYARGPLGTSAIAMTGVVYSTVAVFLLNRLPRNPIGWIFLMIGLGMAAIMPVNLALTDALRSFQPVPQGALFLAWGITSMQIPASGALLVVVLLLFPAGRPDWRGFRPAAGLALLGCLLMTMGSLLEPAGLLWYPSLPNPRAAPVSWLPVLVAARVIGMILLVVSLVLAAARLGLRFRAGDAFQRRQLGWILLGGVAMTATLGPLFAVRYALGASDDMGERVVFVAAIGGCLFPITVAIAAMRERLFGIEGIVARTLVYVPLMAILGGLYTASVALFNRIFVAVTGNPSDAAIVMATLLLAGALTPVRRSLEGLVERNTRGRAGAAAAQAPPPDSGHDAILARLAELERRLAEMTAAAQAAAQAPAGAVGTQAQAQAGGMGARAGGMGAQAMDALQLPAAGEGGLPEPTLSPPNPGAVPLAPVSPGTSAGGTSRGKEPASHRVATGQQRLSRGPGGG
jgi:hypothetical protein